MMHVIREELRLQRVSGPRSIGDSALSALDAHAVGCVELDPGQCCEHFHFAAAVRVTELCRKKELAVSAVAIDHIVVVIAAAHEHHLLFLIVNVSADRLRLRKIKRRPLDRNDLSCGDRAAPYFGKTGASELQHLVRNAAAVLAGEVKIGMIRQVNDCPLI